MSVPSVHYFPEQEYDPNVLKGIPFKEENFQLLASPYILFPCPIEDGETHGRTRITGISALSP
jgi:hypothetical protein